MRTLHTLVELVELHKHAAVRLVEVESALHILEGHSPPLSRGCCRKVLVETGQREVTPDGGELGVKTCRQLPILHSKVVLPLVVVETAEIVGRAGTVRIHRLGQRQHDDVF